MFFCRSVMTLRLLSHQNGVKRPLGRMGKGGVDDLLNDRV